MGRNFTTTSGDERKNDEDNQRHLTMVRIPKVSCCDDDRINLFHKLGEKQISGWVKNKLRKN